MTAPPRVSVVIPVLNGAAYIDQALGSVAAQRRLPDEVIVVDDGSTDATAATAARWEPLLPLRVISLPENRGCWAARQVAIDSTDAELIALLDADDVWLPDHLGALLEAYEVRPGLVTANALRWIQGTALATTSWDVPRPVPPPERQLQELLLVNYVFIAALFARADCERVGGFRDWPAGCEDWDLWLRLVAAGAIVTRVPMPTVLYRLRPDSMSAGDALLDTEIEVLERFKVEHDRRDARRAADVGIRRRRAKQHVRDALDAAGRGRGFAARAHALRAIPRATGGVRLAAAALAASPKRAAAHRARLAADPAWQVSR